MACASLVLLCGACTAGSGIGAQIDARMSASERAPIDLSRVGPDGWERLCVLPPYTDNERARQLLGFAWDAQARTSIATNDSIAVLVFVRDTQVLAHVEYPRGKGDFSQLRPPCLPRDRATVVRQVRADGWVLVAAAP